MNRTEASLRRAVSDLGALHSRWVLVGGFAVSARVEPRLTRDVDVAVATPDDAAAEQLIADLRGRGWAPVAAVEQDAVGRLATVRLVPAGGSPAGSVLDVLFASSGIEEEMVDLAEELEVIPDLVIPVARAGHLVALKLLARDDERRPQDAADLRALRTVLDDGDRDLALHAVGLIMARGYARGRNLRADLDALLATGR